MTEARRRVSVALCAGLRSGAGVTTAPLDRIEEDPLPTVWGAVHAMAIVLPRYSIVNSSRAVLLLVTLTQSLCAGAASTAQSAPAAPSHSPSFDSAALRALAQGKALSAKPTSPSRRCSHCTLRLCTPHSAAGRLPGGASSWRFPCTLHPELHSRTAVGVHHTTTAQMGGEPSDRTVASMSLCRAVTRCVPPLLPEGCSSAHGSARFAATQLSSLAGGACSLQPAEKRSPPRLPSNPTRAVL